MRSAAGLSVWSDRGRGTHRPVVREYRATASGTQTTSQSAEPTTPMATECCIGKTSGTGASPTLPNSSRAAWTSAETGFQFAKASSGPGTVSYTHLATDGTGAVQTDQVQRSDPDGATGHHSVSYTHLDVYKRQTPRYAARSTPRSGPARSSWAPPRGPTSSDSLGSRFVIISSWPALGWSRLALPP